MIAADVQGVGEVVRVEHAGGSGHPGTLDLQFDYVYAAATLGAAGLSPTTG